MIIWGFRGRVRPLATVRTRYPRCGQQAAHRLVRSQRWFTLFFIPIVPFRTRYTATCTYCGARQVVKAAIAKAVAARSGAPPATVPAKGAAPASPETAPEAAPGYSSPVESASPADSDPPVDPPLAAFPAAEEPSV